MKKRAQELYFWPGMNNEVAQHVASCDPCQVFAPSKAKNMDFLETKAERPMESISADLFEAAGKQYLILVDRYSSFPFVERLNKTTTEAVTTRMLGIFQMFGFPSTLKSDQGPQFRGPFQAFCKEHGINHETSSPYNPQSNGQAEAAVKNTKTLLKKVNYNWADFNKALLE